MQAALNDIYDFLYNANGFLVGNGWERLEEIVSAATFSGVMSEPVISGISSGVRRP